MTNIDQFPSTKLGKYTVYYTDHQEFSILKNEIFTQKCYHFETENITPYIFDIGAHIGLSTLYFKQLYPASTIECFEPHPDLVPFLEQNVWLNDLENVYVHAVGLGPKGQTDLTLHWDPNEPLWLSTSSTHPFSPSRNSKSTQWETASAPVHQLADYLAKVTPQQDVDLIKLDVEGAEGPIINDARPYFGFIRKWLIEFHPYQSSWSLSDIEKLLSKDYELRYWQAGKKATKNSGGLLMIEASRM